MKPYIIKDNRDVYIYYLIKLDISEDFFFVSSKIIDFYGILLVFRVIFGILFLNSFSEKNCFFDHFINQLRKVYISMSQHQFFLCKQFY